MLSCETSFSDRAGSEKSTLWIVRRHALRPLEPLRLTRDRKGSAIRDYSLTSPSAHSAVSDSPSAERMSLVNNRPQVYLHHDQVWQLFSQTNIDPHAGRTMTTPLNAEYAIAAATEDQLKHWTLDIVNRINAHDPQTALDRYAAPDYIYENTEDNGQVLHLNAREMLRLREFYFQELSPHVTAQVLSTEVHIDWHSHHATVWVGMQVHNDVRGVRRERMNIFSWRKEAEKWVWWREHTSAGFVQVAGV